MSEKIKNSKPKKSVKKSEELNVETSVENQDIKAKEVSSNSNKSNIFKTKKFKNSVLIVLITASVASILYLNKQLFVAALVNGQPITRLEIIKQLEKEAGKQTLEGIINKTIVTQHAKKQNISVSDQDVNKEIDKIKEQLKSSGQDFDQILAMQNLTLEQVKEQVSFNMLLKKLLADKIKVSDEEVNAYIEENKASFPEETDTTSEQFRTEIKESLENQKLGSEAQTLISDLTSKASVEQWVSY